MSGGRGRGKLLYFFPVSLLRRGFFRRSPVRVVSAPFAGLGSGWRRSVERRSGLDRRSFPLGDSILVFAIDLGCFW